MGEVKRTHNLRDHIRVIEGVLDRALTGGALLVVSSARKNAPEDTGDMTRETLAGRPRWRRGRREILIGTSKKYGIYHELPRYISQTKLGPKSIAKGAVRPWLGPALEENKDEITHIVIGLVRRGFREIAL